MCGCKVLSITLVAVLLHASVAGAIRSAKEVGSALQAEYVAQQLKGREDEAEALMANPIRKVVNMLQNMVKKLETEAAKEDELYEKFGCYCKTNVAELDAAISSSTARVPAVQSEIETSESTLASLKLALEDHQKSRSAAKVAMEDATALREKEHAAYESEAAKYTEYITALSGAIPAIEQGMGAPKLLQMKSAAVAAIRRAADADSSVTEDDKQYVLAFLSGASSTDNYAPGSMEIVGILKTMKEDFSASLASVESAEEASVKVYEELMAAKEKEIKTLSQQIETKTARVGELSVKIVTLKAELSDEEAALVADQKFLKDLTADCSGKKGEYDERVKVRAEELTAIHETIKILNDDDALDLFKKTLPSASFVQLGRRSPAHAAEKALSLLCVLKPRLMERRGSASDVRFLEIALTGGKVDFSKVFKLIDDMVIILKNEQLDDEHQLEYCNAQIDQAEDKAKELANSVKASEVKLEELSGDLEVTKEDIKVLEKGIAELDKAVEEATVQRKTENEDFTELMSSDQAAKELLTFAKSRLQKFYSPELPSFLQLSSATQASSKREAPPPPPATWDAYQKKDAESKGVISMLDLLIRDLDKEMTEASTQEEFSQKAYEELMSDSAAKRAKDVKSVQLKQKAKADIETSMTESSGALSATKKESVAVAQYTMNLHKECDWLLQNFDLRKTARAEEMENLKQAKAVLSGADFSLLEAGSELKPSLLSRRRSN
mmetsp:Transcript_12822/g.24151  ORF Transcript_12822/g.24151 Transcript_12822/m.24151 type:complete len:727 (-) Transcript_12822:41-2221(-)